MKPVIDLLSGSCKGSWTAEHTAVVCTVMKELVDNAGVVPVHFNDPFEVHVQHDEVCFFAALVQ